MRGDFATRFHIGKDICPTERIDRLFRVTNQQQGSVWLLTPDPAENPVLLGVGILKFIDHRHRETATNSRSQRITIVAVQGLIETTEHIVKAQLATAALFPRHCGADLCQRAGDHQIVQGQRLSQQSVDGGKQRVLRHFATRFCPLRKKRLRELFQRVRQLIAVLLLLSPGRHTLDVFCLVAAVELTPVDTRTFNNRVDFRHAAAPLLLHGDN